MGKTPRANSRGLCRSRRCLGRQPTGEQDKHIVGIPRLSCPEQPAISEVSDVISRPSGPVVFRQILHRAKRMKEATLHGLDLARLLRRKETAPPVGSTAEA